MTTFVVKVDVELEAILEQIDDSSILAEVQSRKLEKHFIPEFSIHKFVCDKEGIPYCTPKEVVLKLIQQKYL